MRDFLLNAAATARAWWAWFRAEEPARLAERVRLLLVAGVTLGWLTIDDARINAIVSAVALAASVFASRQVRAKVTPTAKLDGCAGVCDHNPETEH